ncbi:DUF2399 domain-containing protein [Bacillus aquiflavi]|uniref:DUF2399 domain-containing protein n=1 Tax=Bacillus aquiflavi TaxID=2672567 RepID=A0A6B3VS26_9BACI|nr:TIGR02679 domain-containing protein [Bacillus aquiflavi]MBA4536682.1 DUF2399 domain-containing protein [Bacillus aquiflavi]NEY81050.1 DUF2399 domain-containing protein [Bacillus aquiflavi]UAC48717.1 DUF2399 domain-containing protein [Bacillus aquiflavi]
MSKEKLADARQFFREHPVYDRLFTRFKKKYQSLGKIGGTVKISDFPNRDLIELASFFGTTRSELLDKGKGKLSLLAFERQLERTKFDGIPLLELLESFFEEKILTNNELKKRKEIYIEESFRELSERFPVLTFWFQYLQKKSADTYWIYRLLEGKKSFFYHDVRILSDAFKHLPKDGERIAMFSHRLTKDPHAFDQNTELGKLWLHLLSVHSRNEEEGEITIPSDSEAISQLLERYMLYRDDITNDVTVVNIQAETAKGSHPVWKAATTCEVPTVLNVPIRELTSLTRAYPAGCSKKVWIVENSGVFSTILDRFPTVPLICTHGQFKLASLKLMDLFVKEECLLMYAGDFDPEGLTMLQRLMLRYENFVVPWRMDVTHYEASDPTVMLSEDRLAKLKSITINELQPVKEAMLKRKKAGYQEAIVPLYFNDLA